MSLELKNVLLNDNYVLVDVRSPKEYKEDHIIGSLNIPLLDNDERAVIGTMYKQVGRKEAIDKGYEIVNPKLDEIIRCFKDLPEGKIIVPYCFRGGMRSSTVVDYLKTQGFQVEKLEGGYKNYRRYVIDFLDDLSEYEFIVLHGNTGVGKTELLLELQRKGKFILDLEDYASNSGSVFGEIYYKEPSPTQKFFESQILNMLMKASKAGETKLYMESESKKIGRCTLGRNFWEKMINGTHIYVEASLKSRVKRCVDDYTKKCFDNDDKLIRAIGKLRDTLGKVKEQELIEATVAKDYTAIAGFLMEYYYDPLYQHSIEKYKYIKTVNSEDVKSAVKEILNGEDLY